MIQSYRDLRVWQRAMQLNDEACRLVRLLPRNDPSDLASQLARAAGSVPSNIAEGQSRVHLGDFIHHLSYAKGSLGEVETQLAMAMRNHLLPEPEVARALGLANEVGRMLTVLIRRLRQRQARS